MQPPPPQHDTITYKWCYHVEEGHYSFKIKSFCLKIRVSPQQHDDVTSGCYHHFRACTFSKTGSGLKMSIGGCISPCWILAVVNPLTPTRDYANGGAHLWDVNTCKRRTGETRKSWAPVIPSWSPCICTLNKEEFSGSQLPWSDMFRKSEIQCLHVHPSPFVSPLASYW